ncbi:MAG: AmmeMemoRadiSam system protein B [Burkholderiales bacterium]|nr:AmmeMemoRadiSam system protein B [Burkholderiales bacterium]
MSAVRPAAVAGMFYPGERDTLAREITGMLEEARERELGPGFPKAVIVPHAGYIYSGPVAANAYALLRPARGVVKRVVLLGPCHRVPVRGLALPDAAAFETPLGRVPVDAEAVTAARALPQVSEYRATHAQEHSLEVQLPFLQEVLGDFTLVPFVVGAASANEVAEVIEKLWGGPETLVVVSSDLSHYHPYDEARAMDEETARAILAGRTDLDHEQACGATPIAGLLTAAARRGLEPELLDLRNSGDTAGGKGRVVGYASFAFWEGERTAYAEEHGRALVGLARRGIASKLGAGPAPHEVPWAPWLHEQRATFVTLKRAGELRGCIGSLQARRALGVDVASNARAAAFSDPRFAPLTAAELPDTEVEVSVLSHPVRVLFSEHRELVAQLRPGMDGLILAADERRGTFLPQVWEQLPEPEAFLAHLKRKAGLDEAFPTRRCTVWRYQVRKWREQELATQ